MKSVNSRTALMFALFLGVAAAASLIAYAGSAAGEPEVAAPQPALMSIPF